MHTYPIEFFAREITDPVTHRALMLQIPGPKAVAFLGLGRNDAGELMIVFGDNGGPIQDDSITKLVQVGIITNKDGMPAVLLTMRQLTKQIGEITVDEWHDLACGLAVYLEDDKFAILAAKGNQQGMANVDQILCTQDDAGKYVPMKVGQSSPLGESDFVGGIRDFVIGNNKDGLVFSADKAYGYALTGTQLIINLLAKQELGIGAITAERLDEDAVLVRGIGLLLDATKPPVETWAYVVEGKDGKKEMVFVDVQDLRPVKRIPFTGDLATGCPDGNEIITVMGAIDEVTGAQTIQIDRSPAMVFVANQGNGRDKNYEVTHTT